MIEKSDLRELVFRLEHARKSLIGPKFRALGLPLGQGQPRILNSLFKKQHVTQKELADSCFMDTTTLSRVLDRMTESGLVTRETNPACRRSWLVCLTPKGLETAKKVHQIFSDADALFWQNFSDEELAVLYQGLIQVCENLEAGL